MEEGKAYPMAILIKVYGRKFQSDFEPVLERRIHYFMNYGEGVWHMGQRDQNWMRVSKEAVGKGLTLSDIGKIMYAYFKKEYAAIIDRLEVQLITDQAEVDKVLEEARQKCRARDDRQRHCVMMQLKNSIPAHCVGHSLDPYLLCSPGDRLCGAVWLDATYEIDPWCLPAG